MFSNNTNSYPFSTVQDGITQFNAVLVGSVVMSLKPVFAGGDLDLMTWLMVLAGASTSVIVQTGLGNILSRKVDINQSKLSNKLIPVINVYMNKT